MEPTGRTFFRALGVLVRRLIRNVRRCQFDDANPDSLMLTALFVTARIIANPVSNVFQKQRESRLHHRRHARVADAGDASPAVRPSEAGTRGGVPGEHGALRAARRRRQWLDRRGRKMNKSGRHPEQADELWQAATTIKHQSTWSVPASH